MKKRLHRRLRGEKTVRPEEIEKQYAGEVTYNGYETFYD